MQNLQYATSDPQENRCPPGAKCNKVGCVSSASNPGLHSLSVGHTYSLLLNHLLSSFKRLNGVAKAGGRTSWPRFGLESTAFSLSSGNIHYVGTCSDSWPKPLFLLSICEKSQVASFYLRMEVGKKFSVGGNVCETSGKDYYIADYLIKEWDPGIRVSPPLLID